MIRQFILDQLAKCSFATPVSFDEATNTFVIPRYSKPVFAVGSCYLIEIPPHLLSLDALIAANWNAGRVPPMPHLKAFVSKTMGKMIYVDSVAYNIETNTDLMETWSGWLPCEEIKQLAVLNGGTDV